MAKYPFFQLPSQYFLNILIIRGDSMDNVDLCVWCGSIIPEGSMVCLDCARKYKSVSEKDTIAFIEELCGIKLYWYQRLLLKMLERSIKNPRKGLHRYL